MTTGRLLAIGGAHIDRRGQTAGPHVPAASNPGAMREEVGGGAYNAMRAAVQRGADGSLLSMRGGDAAGEAVTQAVRAAEINDLSATFLDRATPSYTALLDEHGDLITGLADMSLYDEAFLRQLGRRRNRDAIAAADHVLADANVPAAGLEAVAALRGAKPLHAIAVSPAKVIRLRTILPKLGCLFMNRNEAAALAGSGSNGDADTVSALRNAGLVCGVISRGAGPLLFFNSDGVWTVAPPSVARVVDVTGAGDALAGTTIAAMMRGEPLRVALREGMAAATLAIQTASAAPDLTTDAFRQTLETVPPATQAG